MPRIWFNKTFSNVRAVFDLIRQGDADGEFHLFCTHTKPDFPGFLSAHESALEPPGLVGSAYVDDCLEFCRTHEIDAFWPGKEAPRLAAEAHRFAERGIKLLTPAGPDNLKLLQDKARFYAEARRFSVPPADYREIRTAEEFESAYAQLKQSHEVLCVKPADGVNGAGFRVIDETRNGLEILLGGSLYAIDLAGLRRILAEAGRFKTLLLMEFLDGPEYSVDCVGDGQRLVAHVQRKKSNTGGYGQRLVREPELERAVAEMTEAYGLRGLFNAQFRQGRNGFRLLEINPRFSGGIGNTAAAGINLPYLAMHGLIHGFGKVPVPDIATGARVLEVSQFRRIEDPA